MPAVRIASYNVHRAIGGDGRCDPSRILQVLREIDADVIALQEVEAHDSGTDMLRWLGKEMGYHAVAGTTLVRHDGHYGNGVLSRWPIKQHNLVDLSWRRREPRGAIAVDINFAPDQHLRVVATHLGLQPAERRDQVQRLLRLFTWGPDEAAVLIGDLNEWFLWGRPLRRLHQHFAPTPPRRTFPSRMPMLALDRVWTHPASILKDLRAHRSALSRIASDHLPLVATLEI